MTRAGRFVALPAGRRKIFVFTLVLMAVAKTAITFGSFRRVSSTFDRIPKSDERPATVDIRWATHAASAQVPGTNCLVRGIVAHTLCRRYGHESSLYVGVDRDSEEFAAHSWVESGGEVVVGDDVDLSRYETLGVVAS